MAGVLSELFEDFPRASPERIKYIEKAFRTLPGLDKPRILDIGCGKGAPTLELARLSQGEITGIDTNQSSLDKFKTRIKEAGLSHRVKTVNASMFNIDLPDRSFDIIWSEGSIFAIGFVRGLKEWQRLIKPNGFLVVHEMVWLEANPPQPMRDYWKKIYPEIGTVEDNLASIVRSSYKLVDHFKLPDNIWWIEYYGSLEGRVKRLKQKYRKDADAMSILNKEEQEIELYKKYSRWYGSAYFIMQNM